jgi:hypothetical protein
MALETQRGMPARFPMTPAHQPQQQEYIITMGRIIKARNMLMADGYHNADVLDCMVNLLRARPHTNPPAPIPNPFSIITDEGFEGVVKAIEERAAKAEREKVLEDLRKLCMNDESVGYTVFRHIQSLRAQQRGA